MRHERGPQPWVVNLKDGKFCRASLSGVIDFP